MRDLFATHTKFRGQFIARKWVLCIGAGASIGIVPTWQELARRLINETFGISLSEADFKAQVDENGWSLDSWIQACANHFVLAGKKLSEFVTLLEKHLYSELLAKADIWGIKDILIGVLDNHRTAPKDEVDTICRFFEKEYPNSSLISLTKSLISAAKQGRAPEAIISFNADTLLHTLIELFQRDAHYKGPGPHSHPEYYFKTVLRPLTSSGGKVPIYHCHGSIKPTGSIGARPPVDSRDKLVFLESEYIRVATSSASWAETLFMYYVQTRRMLFLGVSLSDPNMRRWLALANESTLRDLESLTRITSVSLRHLWLTRISKNPIINTVKSEALIHLGVRPAWIDDWSQTELALTNLLALS